MFERPAEIQVSDEERNNQALSPENLSDAQNFIREQGYLIVRGVFAAGKLDGLRQILDDEWQKFCARKPAWRGGGKIIGHINLIPPKQPEFINPDILGNSIVHSIISAVLGDNARITGIGGNTNLPNSVDQYFHSDLDAPDVRKLMVNIPLGDVDEGNGSLELIPGFERNWKTDSADAIRANTRSGSVIIRYPHVLHRGKRNSSTRPRHMVGFWVTALTPEEAVNEKLCLDPRSADILADCARQFEALGQGGAQPVFGPNYFAPTRFGLIKEILYRTAPGAYLFLVSRLKKS